MVLHWHHDARPMWQSEWRQRSTRRAADPTNTKVSLAVHGTPAARETTGWDSSPAQPVLPSTQLPPAPRPRLCASVLPQRGITWGHHPRAAHPSGSQRRMNLPTGCRQSREQLQADALCKMRNSSLRVPWLTTAYFFWDPLLRTTVGDKEYKNIISTKQLLYSWKMKVHIVKKGKWT